MVSIPYGSFEIGDYLDTFYGESNIRFKTTLFGGTMTISNQAQYSDRGSLATLFVDGGCDYQFNDYNTESTCNYTETCNTNHTTAPTIIPSDQPSAIPSDEPSAVPSNEPSINPTDTPTISPSDQPTVAPSDKPTISPTDRPTLAPIDKPSVNPSERPTTSPYSDPTASPITLSPSDHPSAFPSDEPSDSPTDNPTFSPNANPSSNPSTNPSTNPSGNPITNPSTNPSTNPTTKPSVSPTDGPSVSPSNLPSINPSNLPTLSPTDNSNPSTIPTISPTVYKPNIIIFYIDDFSYTSDMSESYPDTSGFYNDINTTWINKIRNEGFIFPYTYAGGPKCSPSRFALLTGRYPSRSLYGQDKAVNGANNDYDAYNGTEIDVPQSKMNYIDANYSVQNILKEYGGYRTGMVGKWHLLGSATDYCGEQPDYYLNLTQMSNYYANCVDKVQTYGWDWVDGLYIENLMDDNGVYSHNPEWMLDVSQNFMNESIDVYDKPFFLYFAHTLTHTPLGSVAMFDYNYTDTPKGILTGDDIPYPSKVYMPEREDIWNKTVSEGWSANRFDTILKSRWMDETLGGLYKWLKIKGILDNTIIMVMNDHGQGAKESLYEQGIRIMNFIRYPALGGNKTIYDKFLMSNVDVPPTLFDLVGLDLDYLKNTVGYEFDGYSWLNQFKTDNVTNFEYRFAGMYQSRAIVTLEYKYIWRATNDYRDSSKTYPYNDKKHQLYDLIDDGEEQVQLYNNSRYKDDLLWLQGLMIQHLNDTCPLKPYGGTCQTVVNQNNHYLNLDLPTKAPVVRGIPTSQPTDAPITYRYIYDPVSVRHDVDLYGNPGDIEWIEVEDGVYETTLIFDVSYKFFEQNNGDYLNLRTRLHNDSLPSPTMRFKRGNEYRVRLVNNLGPESPNNPSHIMNGYKDPNTTNIHTHGMHISGEYPGDYIFTKVEPGSEHTFIYNVPCDHAGGTMWYHPHHHGSITMQVGAGCAGMLIVEYDQEEEGLPNWLVNMTEYTVVLQMLTLGFMTTISENYTENVYSFEATRYSDRNFVAVNGVYKGYLKINSNEWSMLRMLLIDVNNAMWLNIEGCDLQLIARDGVLIRGLNDTDIPRNVTPDIFLSTASRADIAIYCPGDPVSGIKYYPIVVNHTDEEEVSIIAWIEVDGYDSEIDVELTQFTPIRPNYLSHDFVRYNGELQKYPHKRKAGQTQDYFELQVTSGSLNGELFGGENNYMANISIGTVNEWQVTNIVQDHPLHVHVNHFQLINKSYLYVHCCFLFVFLLFSV